MFKIIILLVVCYFSYSQAFQCEFPCPENSLCTAENKCTCSYGYREKISEFDGFPYCQWQGTTTTKKVSADLAIEPKVYQTHEDDLVDDNSELFGDYRYQKEQKDIDMEEEIKKQKQKMRQLFMANKNAVVDDISVIEKSQEFTSNDYKSQTNFQQKQSVFPFVRVIKASESNEEQDYDESNNFKKLLLENEISRRYYKNNAEKPTTIVNKNFYVNPEESTTSFAQTEIDAFTFPTFLRRTTAEETTDVARVVKVIKHVEQHIHNGSAVQTFYTTLGVFCTFLAFLFAVTVLFDCVKL